MQWNLLYLLEKYYQAYINDNICFSDYEDCGKTPIIYTHTQTRTHPIGLSIRNIFTSFHSLDADICFYIVQ